MLEVVIFAQLLLITLLVYKLSMVNEDVLDRKSSANAQEYIAVKSYREELKAKAIEPKPEVLVDGNGDAIPQHELQYYKSPESIFGVENGIRSN